MSKFMTVKEVAILANISIRTLHYYDEIGLLKPSHKNDSQYRLYDNYDIKVLWQILFLKELDFNLKQIKEIINNPSFDKVDALLSHKKLLIKKRDRINNIITSIDKVIEKGFDINMLNTFNTDDYEKYKEEAIKKYGRTAKDSYKNTSKYTKSQRQTIMKEAQKIYSDIAKNMDKSISSEIVQDLIHKWRNHITKYYYNCTLEIFQGLGDLYIQDERFTRNIDKTKEGLAQYLKEAIDYYCELHNK